MIKVDPKYFRPAEVDLLIGDPTKATKTLGWTAKTNVNELAKIMVEADFLRVKEQLDYSKIKSADGRAKSLSDFMGMN